MTTTLRSGMKVPTPRVTVQQFAGETRWVVLVDGIEDSEHKTKALAQAQARETREALRP